jgi:hypothetical protein
MPVLYPQPRRGVRRTVLGILVTLLALAATGFVLAQPILREYPARLTRPASVAGMPMLTDAYHKGLAEHVRARIAARVPDADLTAAYYASDSNPAKPVLVVAGTALSLRPGWDVDHAFEANPQLRLTGLTRVDPGFLGGAARCGQAPDGSLSLCAWADHGSVGIVVGYGRAILDTASLMRDIRPEIVYRY